MSDKSDNPKWVWDGQHVRPEPYVNMELTEAGRKGLNQILQQPKVVRERSIDEATGITMRRGESDNGKRFSHPVVWNINTQTGEIIDVGSYTGPPGSQQIRVLVSYTYQYDSTMRKNPFTDFSFSFEDENEVTKKFSVGVLATLKHLLQKMNQLSG